jgi:HPt (histidine-containing phosphotransfer) domain-containing protein
MSKVQSFDSQRTRKLLYIMIAIIVLSVVVGSYFSYQSTQALNAISQISSLESEAEQRQYSLLVHVPRLVLFNIVLMLIISLLAVTAVFIAIRQQSLIEAIKHSGAVERSETIEASVEKTISVKTNMTKCDEKFFAVPQGLPQSMSRYDSPKDTVIDINYILENMDGDKESVVILLEVFREEHLADGLRLRELIEGSHLEEALRLVHNLKEVAGSLGTQKLKVELERLESCYYQQGSVTVNDADKLTDIIYLVVNAINEYLAAEIKVSSDTALNTEAEKTLSVIDISDEVPDSPCQSTVDKEPLSLAVTSKAAIDIRYILESMDGDSDSVQMLLGIFMDEHISDAEKLRQLVSQCELTNISEPAIRIVHSLKSVAGNLGAERLKEIAGDIETKFMQHQIVSDAEYHALSQALDECITQAASGITEGSNIHA